MVGVVFMRSCFHCGIEHHGTGNMCDFCNRKIASGDFSFINRKHLIPEPPKITNMTRLVPKGKLGTVATIIDEIVEKSNDIDEIYICAKFKDGASDTFVSGKLDGLTFAILMLQDRAINALNGKDYE